MVLLCFKSITGDVKAEDNCNGSYIFTLPLTHDNETALWCRPLKNQLKITSTSGISTTRPEQICNLNIFIEFFFWVEKSNLCSEFISFSQSNRYSSHFLQTYQ